MQIVNTYAGLQGLDLPIIQKQSLIIHIAEAFQGDLDELEKNWEELGVTLILIDESDTDKEIADMDEATQHLVDFAIQYSEYVLILDSMVIALAILNDHGSGCYVAGNISSTTHPIQRLIAQVES